MRLDECTEAEARMELERMANEIPDAPREQSPFEGRARQPRADLNGGEGGSE
jgi:hypothetical protein